MRDRETNQSGIEPQWEPREPGRETIQPAAGLHLPAALLAVAVCLLLVAAGEAYAGRMEEDYVHALAPGWFPQKMLGVALQRAAFRQPDLLPVYGGSELGWPDPFQAERLLAGYPTGFTPFTVGRAMSEPLIIAERLAAIGPELRGKPIVITLSPDFAMSRISPPGGYGFNFSALHAFEFALSGDLSWELKQAGARRMLDYPRTLAKYPLLTFLLQKLAGGSPADLVGYYVAWPLVALQERIIELQDHWETVNYIRGEKLQVEMPHKAQKINWNALLTRAQTDYAARSDNNPFGFENEVWTKTYGNRPPEAANSWSGDSFVRLLDKSKGWEDLDLLLAELQELGARPLVISAPLHAAYYDYIGVSETARGVYYQKLATAVRPFGFPLLDFREHENDGNFLIDPLFHLSSVGWVYYTRAFDDWFHGRMDGVLK